MQRFFQLIEHSSSWLLAVGYWLLAIGYWLLFIREDETTLLIVGV